MSNHSNRKFKKVSKTECFKISFLEVPILEHEKLDRFTDTVPMNNVKIDNRIWRQQMVHNQFQNFQRQVYVNPAIFQLLAGNIFSKSSVDISTSFIQVFYVPFFWSKKSRIFTTDSNFSKNDVLINSLVCERNSVRLFNLYWWMKRTVTQLS